MVECLVPDFRGNQESVATVVRSGLDVFAHNIETVENLTPFVRDRRAKYRSENKNLQNLNYFQSQQIAEQFRFLVFQFFYFVTCFFSANL